MNSNSQTDLLAFLDFLASKGLMTVGTVNGRKAAIRTLFSVLDEAELTDVTSLNLDEVSMRFLNKRGAEFKPESVRVYKSRVAGSIDDFRKYRADPLNFKIANASKPVTRTSKPAASQAKEVAGSVDQSTPQTTGVFLSPSEIVFPIPIRPDVVVKVVGLPSDLTKTEAARIGNVINALALLGDP
ncbi:hypothetical protein [Bradyrhizobium vignae]|uniref:hypothetical protein n=1 Tax=Bradyrhizobium vignae TaxID=1549949 RepID=UPI00100A2C46|nr:hypothetical protein [Bradyrhizobium vignae]RXH06296.1 hypothetical protein EAV90_03835 [Bradyrhizobium vignae]